MLRLIYLTTYYNLLQYVDNYIQYIYEYVNSPAILCAYMRTMHALKEPPRGVVLCVALSLFALRARHFLSYSIPFLYCLQLFIFQISV